MRSCAWSPTWLVAWILSVLVTATATTALASPPEDEWVEGGDEGEWVDPSAGEDGFDPNAYPDGVPDGFDPNAYPDGVPDGFDPNAYPDGYVPEEAAPDGFDPALEDAVAVGPDGEPIYFDPGAELTDEELAQLTAMLEQQLGDSAAVEQLAKSGYVLCNPQAPREQLVACITKNLEIAEVQVRAKALAQVAEHNNERTATAALIVFLAGFAGLLLLLTPLFLRKRYPGQDKTIFKFSVLATVLFMVNMFLFAFALMILRVTQTIGAESVSPKVAMVDASFTVLKEQANDLVDLFPILFEPTIVQLAEGSDKDMTVLLLENIGKLQQDVAVFERFAGVFRSVNSVLDYTDMVFGLVAVAVFAIGFKDVFWDIVRLPSRAMAAPDEKTGLTIAKRSLSHSGREMLVVLAMIFVILVLTAIAGATMRAAVGPAVEGLLAFVVLGVFHVQLTPDASTFAIYLGLGGMALILLLDIAVVLISNVLFLSRAQKLIRARIQQKVPLRANWKFFVYGLAIVVGVQLLPWIYLEIADVVFELTLGNLLGLDDPPIGFVLAFGGIAMLGGWLAAFWAARGLVGLRWLLHYPMPKPPGRDGDPGASGSGSAPRVEPSASSSASSSPDGSGAAGIPSPQPNSTTPVAAWQAAPEPAAPSPQPASTTPVAAWQAAPEPAAPTRSGASWQPSGGGSESEPR